MQKGEKISRSERRRRENLAMAARERAIREWQVKHGYNAFELDAAKRAQDAERLRVITACYDWGVEIQGKTFAELQYIVDNKLI